MSHSGSALAPLAFGPIRLLVAQRQLWIDDAPVKLGARAFDLLVALAQRRDRMVTKDELIELVWPGVVVEENNLQVQISALRKVLGAEAVATIPGRGYQFTLAADPAAGGHAAPPRGSTPSNLPAPVTPLIGRQADVQAVAGLLARSRLVTVTGFGGTGKTRLALEVAAGQRAEFPDGVWFVELAPLSHPSLAVHAVAEVLKVATESNRTPLESVVRELEGRRVLLVLDNCEHLVQACADLAGSLLRACSGLRVLATSRENLAIDGERVHPLAPLPLPVGDGDDGLEAMLANPAVQLFVQRAAAAQAGFRLEPGNAAAVASVCRQVDGIPFALELAAARLRVLSIDQVRAMLVDRFGLLASGGRGGLPHHRTLRATIDWSYDLLDAGQRALLDHLSTFRGGFTLEAAAALSGRTDAAEVLDDLQVLVQKSLVEVDPQPGANRYALLETVREYALAKLAEAGEAQQSAASHLEYFLAVAERGGAELNGEGRLAALRRLHQEHDNLRTALACALQRGDALRAHRMCGALSPFWELRGHYAEGRGWLRQALALRDGLPPGLLARTLCAEGFLAYQQGDFNRSRAPTEEALALSRDAGDRQGVARALFTLGVVSREQGDHARARQLFEQVLAIHDEIGPEPTAAKSTAALNLFVTALTAGDLGPAQSLGETALALARAAGDRRSLGHTLNQLGWLAVQRADYALARELHEQALAAFEELGHRRGIAYAHNGLGLLELALGHPAVAQAWLLRCLQLANEIGYAVMRIYGLSGLARVHLAAGEPLVAAQLQGACARQLEDTGLLMASIERGQYDAARAELVSVLGSAGYESAFRQGWSLSAQQALALASARTGISNGVGL